MQVNYGALLTRRNFSDRLDVDLPNSMGDKLQSAGISGGRTNTKNWIITPADTKITGYFCPPITCLVDYEISLCTKRRRI